MESGSSPTEEVKDTPINSVEDEAKAEEFKSKGNDFFKAAKFNEAAEQYSEAIQVGLKGRKQATYYTNRAFCNIKLENFGLALHDAGKAIEEDEEFPKAYYRRGTAYFALGHLADAQKDFKKLCKLCPKDKDAREKLAITKKMIMEKKFAESIAIDEVRPELDPEEMNVPDSYSGPKLESIDAITPEWVEQLMEWHKDQKTLHPKYAAMILNKCRDWYEKQSSLVEVSIPDDKEFTVCGDVHGQYYDLLNIFKLNGSPSTDNPYLFNGDFVDRGSFSVEVVLTLMAWKACFPEHMHLARGNHETVNMNKMYGFEGEVTSKYSKKFYEFYCDLFQKLPIAHVLNSQVLVLHGGLFSKDGVKLEDIKKVNRFREPADSGIMCESMWSDPCDQDGRHPSKRGVGVMFGPDVAAKFCEDNGLKYVVRSHEVK